MGEGGVVLLSPVAAGDARFSSWIRTVSLSFRVPGGVEPGHMQAPGQQIAFLQHLAVTCPHTLPFVPQAPFHFRWWGVLCSTA